MMALSSFVLESFWYNLIGSASPIALHLKKLKHKHVCAPEKVTSPVSEIPRARAPVRYRGPKSQCWNGAL